MSGNSSGYASALSPDLLDVVDAVWFFLEHILVEVSSERGRSEALVAVGAFLVFGCSRVLSLRSAIGAAVGIVRSVGLWSVNHYFMDQRVESMCTTLNSRDRRGDLRDRSHAIAKE